MYIPGSKRGSDCILTLISSLEPSVHVKRQDDPSTIEYLKFKFKDYYKKAEISLPPEFNSREFGFMFFDTGFVQRHIGFSSEVHLRKFLVQRVPRHVYHSSAYYENPNAPTMEQKGWRGADLIFDLDADHVKSARGLAYEEMLGRVKEEVAKLVDEFLLDDFGFDESELLLTFSGGRGYHIHVRSERIRDLGSHERREIVDYITGVGLDEETVFRRIPYDQSKWEPKYRFELSSSEEPGWAGRATRNITRAVEKLEEMSREEAVGYLASFEGVGEKIAGEIYDALFSPRKGGRGIDRLKEGEVDFFPGDRYLNPFKKIFLQLAVDLGRSETDEPVTSDVKRLIRLTRSLHGGTGFLVVPLTRDQLDEFDPLQSAISETFTEEPVKIMARERSSVRLRGERFNLKEGITELPEYAAIFFMCRGLANIAKKDV